MSDARKYSESLVSSLGHLIGLRKDGNDGKFKLNVGSRQRGRRDIINVENINTQIGIEDDVKFAWKILL